VDRQEAEGIMGGENARLDQLAEELEEARFTRNRYRAVLTHLSSDGAISPKHGIEAEIERVASSIEPYSRRIRIG
jgi:hypothetical protein